MMVFDKGLASIFVTVLFVQFYLQLFIPFEFQGAFSCCMCFHVSILVAALIDSYIPSFLF